MNINEMIDYLTQVKAEHGNLEIVDTFDTPIDGGEVVDGVLVLADTA